MLLQQAEQTVSTIFSLYEKYGAADYIGEPVSQLEHMCQAALLAEQAGSREEVILAAFFHDIGHLCEMEGTASMGGYGVQDHEKWGGIFLKQHSFSDALIRLVGSHVDAKRYLTFKYPTYYAQLSEASKQTLAYQGGPMTATEAAAFEADPLFADMVRLRTWDDQAKATDQPLPDLQRFKQMALHHLMNQ